MPRLHAPGHMSPGNIVSRTRNLYPDTYMSTDTCRRIHVACSGYMLTVSRRHNYTVLFIYVTARSTCIPLYPATDGRQTGDNFVADTETC